MKTHIQVVALLHIALGALSLLAAIAIFLILGFAGGVVASQGNHQAGSIVGTMAVLAGGFLALLALPGIIAGWGLYAGRPWARPAVIVLGILHIFNFPLGTAIGIYTIWVLMYDQSGLTGT